MIDELLDSLLIERLPTAESLEASLAELCRGAVDVEPMLQAFKSSQQLRVGVRDMLGRQDAEATTAALTGIAESLVKQVVAIEMETLRERLGRPQAADGGPAGPIVLAMGKFGGREMNGRGRVKSLGSARRCRWPREERSRLGIVGLGWARRCRWPREERSKSVVGLGGARRCRWPREVRSRSGMGSGWAR
jgi:hypothetical protein